ncbi:MAG: hypothetical protein ACON5B_14970 [Myxococcota bacterium]
MASLYRQVYSRSRRVGAGWRQRAEHALLVIGLTLLCIPLFSSIFMDFLVDQDPWAFADRLFGLQVRIAYAMVAWAGLDAHGAMLRGRNRRVLELLPVRAADVVWAELVEGWIRLGPRVAVLAALTLPLVGSGGVGMWLATVGIVAGAGVFGVPAGAWAMLMATRVAERPSWAAWLDLVRGNNPRSQAAILYALAVPATVGFFAAVLSATGAVHLLSLGEGAAWQSPWLVQQSMVGSMVSVAVWPVLAVGASWGAIRTGVSSWFIASMVLADIDGRVASVERAADPQEVYLEWSIRNLPRSLHTLVLLELRQGWRARRTWLLGTWVAAVGAVTVGWTVEAGGMSRAAHVAILGVGCGAIAMILGARDEGPWLGGWLDAHAHGRFRSRWVAVLVWGTVPMMAAWAVTLFWKGVTASLVVMVPMVLAAIGLGGLAAVAARTQRIDRFIAIGLGLWMCSALFVERGGVL